MSDPFVPEADALDQQREIVPTSSGEETEGRVRDYPDRMPAEAPEGDVLEQSQTVDIDEEFER